jgi:L-ascorbate metabolism protein UlaG (beta-lactamase superfamily)
LSQSPILRRMGAPSAALRGRAAHSPNYRDGAFVNPEPTRVLGAGAEAAPSAPSALRPGDERPGNPLLAAYRSRSQVRPARPVTVVSAEFPSATGDLAVTWLGHASTLVELEGRRFLLDPVLGDRVSPSLVVGPKRLHAAPCRATDLPPVDAVLISHDHYDHLDEPTIAELERSQSPHYVVPLGVDLHLTRWGVPEERITALDWREETEVGGIRLTCTEARHFSGRGFVRNQTLWAGWMLRGEHRSAWFAGDTGPSHCFADIGRDLGPVDLTIVPIGAYSAYWPDIHVDPEQALEVHQELTRGAPGAVMLPVHWATFNLAMHSWAEPIQRACVAASAAGVDLVTPRVGERVDLAAGDPARDWDPWWEESAPHPLEWPRHPQ